MSLRKKGYKNPNVWITRRKRYGKSGGNISSSHQKKVVSKYMKENNPMKNPETIKKVIETQKKLGHHKKFGERIRKYYAIPENKKRLSESKKGKNNPNYKGKLFLNPAYCKKFAEGCAWKPNKQETQVMELLDKHFPNEWKYVGDGYTFIAGLNPDFMNVNGKKLLIEFFGSYWHEKDDEEKRKNHFAKYGFKTLVIWDNELKDINKLIEEIRRFQDGYIKY